MDQPQAVGPIWGILPYRTLCEDLAHSDSGTLLATAVGSDVRASETAVLPIH